MKTWMPFIIFCAIFACVGAVIALNVSSKGKVPLTVPVDGKFTVKTVGSGWFNTDTIVITQFGDWLIQDKVSKKWILLKGPGHVIVNDSSAVRILNKQQKLHLPKGTKF